MRNSLLEEVLWDGRVSRCEPQYCKAEVEEMFANLQSNMIAIAIRIMRT